MKRMLYGYEVVDATKDLNVKLIESDYQRSVRCNKNSCALAEGTKRQEKTKFVEIANSMAYVERNGKLIRYRLGPRIVLAIKLFDIGNNFPPGVYTLKAIAEYERKRRGSANGPNHKNNPNRVQRNQSAKRAHAGCGQLSHGSNQIHVHSDKNAIHA